MLEAFFDRQDTGDRVERQSNQTLEKEKDKSNAFLFRPHLMFLLFLFFLILKVLGAIIYVRQAEVVGEVGIA
jgi:hypothetical protein